MAKQTARNNLLLAHAKRAFNTPTFKRCAELANSDGNEVALAFIGTLCNAEARPGCISEIRTIAKLWTPASIEERRAAGYSLVTADGWSCSRETGSDIKGARLHLRRHAPGGGLIVERDARDGEIFSCDEEAQAYALNAGRLRWWNRAQAAQKEAI